MNSSPNLPHLLLASIAVLSLVVIYNNGQSIQQATRAHHHEITEMIKPYYITIDTSSSRHYESKQNKNLQSTTIAYVISMTKCQPDFLPLDHAAVLLHSIHLASNRNPDSLSNYDYDPIAIIHPQASNCTEKIQQMGWKTKILPEPVLKKDIRGTLKHYVHEASCCQEKEFLKLYAYTLTDYPVVVHLDTDSLILQPLDELYDAMIYPHHHPRGRAAREQIQTQWNNNSSLPQHIEAFFTRDYNMVAAGARQVHQIAVQGGFLVVKPNMEIFQQYLDIILDGNFTRGHGWGGKHLRYGGYYGAAQIQGLCAYFFGHVRPHTAVELNRCVYNWMGDNPLDKERDNRCRTLEEKGKCQDCRNMSIDDIKTIHFTLCGKPIWCQGNSKYRNQLVGQKDHPNSFILCMSALNRWFQTRLRMERYWEKQQQQRGQLTGLYKVTKEAMNYKLTNDWEKTTTFGYCGLGRQSYIPIQVPPFGNDMLNDTSYSKR